MVKKILLKPDNFIWFPAATDDTRSRNVPTIGFY